MLAPPEGLRAPELPGVNPGGRPQESGDDSKVIQAKKIFCDERKYEGWTDRRDGGNSYVDATQNKTGNGNRSQITNLGGEELAWQVFGL